MNARAIGDLHGKARASWPVLSRVMLAIYFCSAFAFAAYSLWLAPPIVIGIVAAQDVGEGDIALISDALEGFDDSYDVRVMSLRLNDSAFPTQNNTWLGFSYLYATLPDGYYMSHGLDIVIVVANRTLVKDFEQKVMVWGIASTTYARATVTVDTPTTDPARHEAIVATTAVHEVLHLMGYTHPRSPVPCVMSSGHIGVELCGGQEWELPLRQSIWWLGRGVPFPIAMFELGITLNFLIVPFFALAMWGGSSLMERLAGKAADYEFKVYSYGALYMAAVIGAYLKTTPNERVAILVAVVLAHLGVTAFLLFREGRKVSEA